MKNFWIFLILIMSNIYNISAAIITPPSQPIFTLNGEVITVKLGYIAPFYFEDENTPTYLYKTVPVSIGAHSFLIKLSNYKGTENDGGYFRIIDIEKNGKNILSLKQSNGWDTIPDFIRNTTFNDYFLSIPLSNNSVALAFIGHTYQSEPELLTIVVIKGNEAKLVFNKQYIILDVQRTADSFVINLQDFPIEYINDDTPSNTAQTFRIWSENGILKFGGPYATITH